MDKFNFLPIEILITVFDFLNTKDLLNYRITSIESKDIYEQIIKYVPIHCNSKIRNNHLRAFANANIIILRDCPAISDAGLKFLSNAKIINLINCGNITDRGLRYLKVVDKISLNNCKNITNDGIKFLRNVNFLDISGCQKITGCGLIHFKKCPVIIINDCTGITKKDIKMLTNLQSVKIETRSTHKYFYEFGKYGCDFQKKFERMVDNGCNFCDGMPKPSYWTDEEYQYVNKFYLDGCKKLIDRGDGEHIERVLRNRLNIYTEKEYEFIDDVIAGNNLEKHIESGIDIHILGEYALIKSAEIGSYENTKLLLDAGANIHAGLYYMCGFGEEAVLYSAIRNNNLEIVKLLIDYGANIHADYDQPLCLSVLFGFDDITKYLLDKGVDINMRNDADVPKLSDATVFYTLLHYHFYNTSSNTNKSLAMLRYL